MFALPTVSSVFWKCQIKTVMEMWLQHAFNGGNWTICNKGYQNHKNSKVSTCKSYVAFRSAW